MSSDSSNRNNSNKKKNKPGPLEGIKVVEYAVFHAGPGAGAILGDMGADIIKIESGIGDPVRYWKEVGGHSFALPDGGSLMHEISNRNKKGIYLDIKSEKGKKIFHDLVKDADVFLTNLRMSTKPKLGVDYESIKKINPNIIHANVTGYGPEGPVSDLGAFDPMGQARSGMMYFFGEDEPALIQLAVLDQATAIAASHAIMTALFVRERTGVAQEVNASLLSASLWVFHVNMMMASTNLGNTNIKWRRSTNSPLRNNFLCGDKKWIIGVHHPDEKYWSNMCEALGREDLIDDPRFKDTQLRKDNCPELVEIFDKEFIAKGREEWLSILHEKGLMFSPVQNINDVLTDPQAIANNYVENFNHSKLGDIIVPGYPNHFSECSVGMRSQAPEIGEHTDEVLKNLGISDDEIEILKEEEVVK